MDSFERIKYEVKIDMLKKQLEEKDKEIERLNCLLLAVRNQCNTWFTKYSNLNEKYQRHLKGLSWNR